jgi:uncharacterized protein
MDQNGGVYMKWIGRNTSGNVQDRRGISGRGVVGGGIGMAIITLVIVLLGGNPSQILGNLQAPAQDNSAPYVETTEEKELSGFLSVVLADTETVWTKLFKEEGSVYSVPTMVLYTGSVDSACGAASSSTGPFYCPGDQMLYIDLSFFQELDAKMNAPGDFAKAYVIAHEVGHHVQTLLGITDQLTQLSGQLSETDYNGYLVRYELQADYFAGVWAHYAEQMNILDPGDIEEALNAASAVGDDRLQNNAYGYTIPDSFTHGTSAQRNHWFREGYKVGTIDGGDTFSAKVL